MTDDMLITAKQVELREPILIAAFRGWNDAGDAASLAATHLAEVWGAEQVHSIDPEEFYDFQAVRPNVELVGGLERRIVWPVNDFLAARPDGAQNDVLLLIGTEPNTRWRRFCEVVVHVARSHGVRLLVTLGALLADVPHTRAVPVTTTTMDDGLATRLSVTRSRYEGPTGIVGVLNDAFSRTDIPAASLWAAVPHYVAVSPNPKAALALVERVKTVTGMVVDDAALRHSAAAFDARVDEVVAGDGDVQAYVRMLEARAEDDSLERELDPSELPSGDALAAELESFLRETGNDDS